jgi:hypothetical protein
MSRSAKPRSLLGRLRRLSSAIAPSVLAVGLLLVPPMTAQAAGSSILRARLSSSGLTGGATVVIGPTASLATAAVEVRGLTARWWLVATVRSGTCSAPGSTLALLKGIAPAGGAMRLWARVPAAHAAALRAASARALTITVRSAGRSACALLRASIAPAPAAGLPAFHHVYVIVMENKEYGQVIGAPSAPYINRLAADYGLATNYDAVAHPSEPNYLALWSGSTQGVADDEVHELAARNVADQLEAKARTWRVYAENLPSGCYTGATAAGGADGAGTYVRKHEPAISFTDVSSSATRCGRIENLASFDPAAADLELIVPNVCHDMHDCSVAAGDAFLAGFVPRILNSAAFAGSVLFVTWDEGTSSTGGGGHVATLVISPATRPGTRSSVAHDHYSLLRTVEDAWGLGCLANSCAANDMRDFFGS